MRVDCFCFFKINKLGMDYLFSGLFVVFFILFSHSSFSELFPNVIPKEDINHDCKKCEVRASGIYQTKKGTLWGAGTLGLDKDEKNAIKEAISGSERNCTKCRLREKNVWVSDGGKLAYGPGLSKQKFKDVTASMKSAIGGLSFLLAKSKPKKEKEIDYPRLHPSQMDSIDEINKEGGYYWRVDELNYEAVQRTPRGVVTNYYVDKEISDGLPTAIRHRLTLHTDGKYHYDKCVIGVNYEARQLKQRLYSESIDPNDLIDDKFIKEFNDKYKCDINRLNNKKISRFINMYKSNI